MYIEMKDICFRYPHSHQVTLEHFSFEAERGSNTCILGKSGSGKSTCLRLIAGLEVPYSGYIRINGRLLADQKQSIPPEQRGVGMVFQDFALFPHMTVEQNIGFGLAKGFWSSKQQRVLEMLELLELTAYRKRFPYELSGGQQQRVALARALIVKPSVLLLDEPLSNLDTILKRKIREELKSILQQAQITTILVTHDIEDCEFFADNVVILHDGKIIQSGSLSEIRNQPPHELGAGFWT